jgi:hypothetical protein
MRPDLLLVGHDIARLVLFAATVAEANGLPSPLSIRDADDARRFAEAGGVAFMAADGPAQAKAMLSGLLPAQAFPNLVLVPMVD